MPEKFVLTAQLKIAAPKNLRGVAKKISQDLSSIGAGIGTKGAKESQALSANLKKVSTSSKTASQSVKKLDKNIVSAAKGMELFGAQTALAIRRFVAFGVGAGAVFKFVSAIKDGTSQALDFERQMIRVAQVAKAPVSSLKGLNSEITRLSTSLGVSSASLAQVSVTLKQTGLTTKEVKIALESLAKTDLAPTFGDITRTTEGAIAILRQFGGGVRSLEADLSSINAIAANFAVESEDLIQVIRKAGGVFKSTGGSLNELLALFTSVRQTTREDARIISTGMRTIFARIQRPKTIQFFKDLGIELRNTTGEFVGGFQAIGKINKAISGLQARGPLFPQIAEQLGGLRRLSQVLPLIQEFPIAVRALSVAQKGQASLTEDSQTALQGMSQQLRIVREEFMALVRGITETTAFEGIFNTVISLSRAFIALADSLRPILPLLTLFGATKLFGGVAGFAKGLGTIGGIAKLPGKTFFAQGGQIKGSSANDNINIRAQAGEFVLNRRATSKIGAKNLDRVNKGFAQGGLVGGVPGPLSNREAMAILRQIAVNTKSTAVSNQKRIGTTAFQRPSAPELIAGRAAALPLGLPAPPIRKRITQQGIPGTGPKIGAETGFQRFAGLPAVIPKPMGGALIRRGQEGGLGRALEARGAAEAFAAQSQRASASIAGLVLGLNFLTSSIEGMDKESEKIVSTLSQMGIQFALLSEFLPSKSLLGGKNIGGRGGKAALGLGVAALGIGGFVKERGAANIAAGGGGGQFVAGGALAGAGGGAIAGLAIAGPFGAAVGAAVGGLHGLVTSFEEADRRIKAVAFEKRFTEFTNNLKAVENDRISAINASVRIQEDINQINLRLIAASGDAREAETGKIRASLPKLEIFLSKLVKSSNTLEDFRKRGLSAVRLLSRFSDIPVEELIKEYETSIKNQKIQNEILNSVNKQTIALARNIKNVNDLTSAIADASDSLSGFSGIVAQISGRRSVGGGVNRGGAFSRLGNIADTGRFKQTVGQVGGFLGPQGQQLGRQVLEANQALTILPDIILGLQNVDAANIADEFSVKLRGLPDSIREKIEQNFETIGEVEFASRLLKEPTKLIEQLGRGIGDIAKPFAQAAQLMNRHNTELANALNARVSLELKMDNEILKLINLREANERTLLKSIGPDKRPSFARTQGLDLFRLFTILGQQAGLGAQPQAIGGQLHVSRERARVLQQQINAGDATKLDLLAEQNLRIQRLNAALEFLADSGKRSAAVLEELTRIEEAQLATKGIAERFAAGGPAERRQIFRATLGAKALGKGGDLEQIPPSLRSDVIGILKQFRTSPIFGGKTGQQVLERQKAFKFGEGLFGGEIGAAGLGKGAKGTRLQQLVQIQRTAEEARRQLIESLEASQDALTDTINKTFSTFRGFLLNLLNQQDRRRLGREALSVTNQLNTLRGKQQAAKELFGIRGVPRALQGRVGEVQKNLPELQRLAGIQKQIGLFSPELADKLSKVIRFPTKKIGGFDPRGGVPSSFGRSPKEIQQTLDRAFGPASKLLEGTGISFEQIADDISKAGLTAGPAAIKDIISRAISERLKTLESEKGRVRSTLGTVFDDQSLRFLQSSLPKLTSVFNKLGGTDIPKLNTEIQSLTTQLNNINSQIGNLDNVAGFAANSQNLGQALNNFPRTVDFKAQHRVEVIFNGATTVSSEVLNKLGPAFNDMVKQQVNKAIDDLKLEFNLVR